MCNLLVLQNMYLGGVPSPDLVSPYVPIRSGFKGCIQKVRIDVHIVNQIRELNRSFPWWSTFFESA